MKLLSIDPEQGALVRERWISGDLSAAHVCTNEHFEHGQWWITCLCGCAWSVNDCVPGVFCFEQVSGGDEYLCELREETEDE